MNSFPAISAIIPDYFSSLHNYRRIYYLKSYENLDIKDHFMFGKICLDVTNCQLILRALLRNDINLIDSNIEKHIKAYDSTKHVRLDLISTDEDGTIYNGELQHKSSNPRRQTELPLRSRYYQSMIDTAALPEGDDYINLPETFIIFICTYDPFGKGLCKYSFDTQCNEIDLPDYSDKAHKIFFNISSDLSSLPPETRNMLEYIWTGIPSDDATNRIHEAVQKARLKEEWRSEYMLTVVHDNDVYKDGYDAGFYESLILLVRDGSISIETAATTAKLSIEEFKQIMSNNK